MSEPLIQTRRWTRVEYARLVEAEVLGPEDRIELLGGELVVKEPQYSHMPQRSGSPPGPWSGPSGPATTCGSTPRGPR